MALGARTVLASGMAGSFSSLLTAQPASATAGDIGAYLSFMDMISSRLVDRWSEVRGAYHPTVGGYSTLVNARMLQVHANAAAVGHSGPSRNDARALSLVSVLLASPSPWRTVGDSFTERDKMFHIPGWTESLNEPQAAMDKAVDPQVAEALSAAWRVAATLGMDAQTAQTIVEHVSSCARGSFFRYPSIRLNQLNWNCALYALDCELTGSPELLRQDYRSQMLRFTAHATRPQVAGDTPNLGAGWHFSYLPNWPPNVAFNLDAAEYANETIDAVRHYDQALAAGMEPLPSWSVGVLRSWAWRVLYGYWTHAGYLNWDTGLGSRRRYIGKVFALAQQGLLAIARTPTVWHASTMSAHARWFFDRGLELYERWAEEDPNGLAPAVQFGDRAHPQSEDSQTLFAARMASNAAQAIALGLGSVKAQPPPPVYSFDPDTQRLAVSTPSYSTAILVHNHDGVPYGGIDLCRLFDGRQHPVGSTGGEGVANFIVRVRDRHGHTVLDSQMGQYASMSVTATASDGSLRVTTPRSEPYPDLPYAGPIHSVMAVGQLAKEGNSIETRHEFHSQRIDLHWGITLAPGGEWELALPSYGKQAEFLFDLSGELLKLSEATQGPELQQVKRVFAKSAQGTYEIEPFGRRPLATLSVVRVPTGSGASVPGPTLTIKGHPVSKAHRVDLSLRLRVL